MNKINLDHIHVPNDLSTVVDNSIQKAKAEEKTTMNLRRFTSVAAMIAVCLIALNFNAAVTFADATKQFFTALYNNVFDNSSRIEAINNDYYSNDVQMGEIENNGLTISLANYYIDRNEAGFEYVITGQNLDEYNDMVIVNNRSIIITDNTSGETQTWEETYNSETGVSTRTFPGGRFLNDPQNNLHEYIDGGIDFLGDARLTKIGEDTYSLVDVIRFRKPIAIGDEIALKYSNFTFIKDNMESYLQEPVEESFDGAWSFKIVIDDKFKNANVFEYEVINGDTVQQKGIVLESVSIDPLVTKLTFSVDYSKNEIANPDNINIVSEPQYAYKLNLMDLCGATVIKVGDNVYENKAGSFVEQENGIDQCVLEFDTLYFQNAESFSVNITERNGEVIKLEIANIK